MSAVTDWPQPIDMGAGTLSAEETIRALHEAGIEARLRIRHQTVEDAFGFWSIEAWIDNFKCGVNVLDTDVEHANFDIIEDSARSVILRALLAAHHGCASGH